MSLDSLGSMWRLGSPKKKLPTTPAAPAASTPPPTFVDPGIEPPKTIPTNVSPLKTQTTAPIAGLPGATQPPLGSTGNTTVPKPEDVWNNRIGSGPIDPVSALPVTNPIPGYKPPFEVGPPDTGIKSQANAVDPISGLPVTPGPKLTIRDNVPIPMVTTEPATDPFHLQDYKSSIPTPQVQYENLPKDKITIRDAIQPVLMEDPPAATPATPATPAAPVAKPPGSADVSGLNSEVQKLLSDLMAGKSQALDFSKKTTINAAERASREAVAAAGQRAAALGFAPGSPEYEKLIQDAKGAASSAGTSALADVTQKAFDQEQQAATQAANFGLGQQNYGLNALTNQQNQGYRDRVLGSSDEQTKIKNLQAIISDPTSSEGQVGWAKQQLGQAMGANTAGTGPNGWASKDPSDPQAQLSFITEKLRVGNPGLSAGDLNAKALEYYNALGDAERQGLVEAMKSDITNLTAANKSNGSGSSDLSDLLSFAANPIGSITSGFNPLNPLSWF